MAMQDDRRRRRVQMCVLRLNSVIALAFAAALLILAAFNTISTTSTADMCKIADAAQRLTGGSLPAGGEMMTRFYYKKYNMSECFCRPPVKAFPALDLSDCSEERMTCNVRCADGWEDQSRAPSTVVMLCTIGTRSTKNPGGLWTFSATPECLANFNNSAAGEGLGETAAPTAAPTPAQTKGSVKLDGDAVQDRDEMSGNGDGADFVSEPSRLLICLSLAVIVCAALGLIGHPTTRRATLFMHHFMLLLLFLSMLYMVGYFVVWARSSDEIIEFYWPFIKDAFSGMSKAEAQDDVEQWLTTAGVLTGCLSLSLLCGIVVSGRMLGLRLLAKNLLILSNISTLSFGVVVAIVSIMSASHGYADATIIAIIVLSITTVLLGFVGLFGAFLEKVHMLNVHFVCMALVATVQLILALNCLIVGSSGTIPTFLKDRYNELRSQWGSSVLGDQDAIMIVSTHMLLVGLLALLMGILMVLNLIASRVLVRSIRLNGRYTYDALAQDESDGLMGHSDEEEGEERGGSAGYQGRSSVREPDHPPDDDMQFELSDLEVSRGAAKRRE